MIRNPFVWLCRFRHRRGYGVHSPFAFDLITQVIYSPGEYYDYEWLDRQFPTWQRLLHLRPLARARLMFRLINFWQPQEIAERGASPLMLNYLHMGCKHARQTDCDSALHYDFVYLTDLRQGDSEMMSERSMLVVDGLQKYRAEWQHLQQDERVTVTFDLHDVGIAVRRAGLQKQNYIVNW